MAGPFVRSPRLTTLLLLLVIVGGFGALHSLPRQEDPTLARRFASITTYYPGASALRVESLVTEKIEKRLQELHEVEEIESLSRAGVSLVTVELSDAYDEEDVDEIWSKLRDKLADAAAELPADAGVPEFQDRTTTAVTLLVGLTWRRDDAPSLGLLSRLAEELAQRLRNVPHTKETELFGEAEEEMRVTVDPLALAAAGLTAADVSRAVSRADAKAPAGALRSGSHDLMLEVAGELTSEDRIRGVPVRQRSDGHSLRVGDLARVEKTVREPAATFAWLGGRRGVAVAATMEPDHRVDRWAEQAKQVVETFRAEVPEGVGLEIVFDQSAYTESRLSDLLANLAFSILIVVAVLFALMGVRSAVLVTVALPLSVALTLGELNLLGVPLHQMSITGLIVAIGILIDNAIIAVDEFDAERRRGSAPLEAAVRSSRYLAVPLFASTITTVLAFLPIALMPGGAGEFVGPIAISVCLAVTSSLLLSLSVVPALAALVAERLPDLAARGPAWWREGWSSPALGRRYRATLEACVARPWRGVAVSLVLPVLGFALGSTLPQQFFPANDRNQFQVQLVLPPQASLEETAARALRAREIVHAHPEVVDSQWFAGEGSPRVFYNMFANQDGVASYAGAFVTTRSADATEALLPRLQRELLAAFPDARVIALPFEQGPPFEAPIELRVFGPDLDELRRLGEELRLVLAESDAVTYTAAKLAGGEPKLMLRADESAARLAGLRLVDIAEQLNQGLEGALGGSVVEANQEIPVRVRVAGEDRRDLARIATGRVLPLERGAPAVRGALPGVPLAALSELDLIPELAGVTRRDGERVNTVQAFLAPYAMISESQADFERRLAASGFVLPSGYRLELGGESEQRSDAVGNLLAFALPLFVLMAGAIVLSFDSFLLAGIIFAVALLSVGLGQLGIWLFGHPMGFVAIVGTMGLVGVAINDSIMVLSALRASPGARAGELSATVDVVMGSTRHLLATTFTTMGGFVPLLFAGRFWPPLAATIAAGVAGATLVALYGVPAVHLALARRELRRARRSPAEPAPRTEPELAAS